LTEVILIIIYNSEEEIEAAGVNMNSKDFKMLKIMDDVDEILLVVDKRK